MGFLFKLYCISNHILFECFLATGFPKPLLHISSNMKQSCIIWAQWLICKLRNNMLFGLYQYPGYQMMAIFWKSSFCQATTIKRRPVALLVFLMIYHLVCLPTFSIFLLTQQYILYCWEYPVFFSPFSVPGGVKSYNELQLKAVTTEAFLVSTRKQIIHYSVIATLILEAASSSVVEADELVPELAVLVEQNLHKTFTTQTEKSGATQARE